MENGEKKKGGCLKVFLIVLLVIVLAIAAAIFIGYKTHEDEIKEAQNKRFTDSLTGQAAPDFEVTTTDGQTLHGVVRVKENSLRWIRSIRSIRISSVCSLWI